jgi:hypothetical protein
MALCLIYPCKAQGLRYLDLPPALTFCLHGAFMGFLWFSEEAKEAVICVNLLIDWALYFVWAWTEYLIISWESLNDAQRPMVEWYMNWKKNGLA